MRYFAPVFAVFSCLALAGAIEGRVVKVADGDSLTVSVGGQRIKVRLDSIDAPELTQRHGKQARDALADLCLRKQAHVKDCGRDRFGRTIGRVTCANQNASAAQVRNGHAWVFRKYAPRDSTLYPWTKPSPPWSTTIETERNSSK